LNGDEKQQFPQFVYDMQDKFYPTISREPLSRSLGSLCSLLLITIAHDNC